MINPKDMMDRVDEYCCHDVEATELAFCETLKYYRDLCIARGKKIEELEAQLCEVSRESFMAKVTEEKEVITITFPKSHKVSNVEVYFQEEENGR